jgi:aromatic-amino-acid transaminase
LPSTASFNPLISASADRPGDDPIFALNAEAKKRADAGESILNATIGTLCEDDGNLSVLPSVFEAYSRIPPEKAAGYAPISGSKPFLDAVVEDLFDGRESAGQAVAVATPGGTGAVHHAIVNTLEPGQKLLTSSYFWGPYAILADHTRRGVATFRMFDESGAFDLASYEAELDRLMAEQGRVLVVLNTPCHNPTGYSLDDDEWGRVVEITERVAGRGPTSLLLDHAYAKFAPPGQSVWRPHVERLAESAGVFIAWTASKSFAQYGARIGSLVALRRDADERRKIGNALGYSCRGTWSNCNHYGMLAVAEVLTDPELRAKSEEERERMRRLLAERVLVFNRHAKEASLSFPRYEGGFFVTVFTPDARKTAANMREHGVYVVPVDGAVRVALCATPASAIPRLVEGLADGIRSVS